MKKLLTTAAAVLAAVNMYGQGKVLFSNVGEGSNPGTGRVWVGAVGTQNGGRLADAGTRYSVALYYDPAGTAAGPEAAFLQIGSAVTIGIGTASPGIFSGGERTIPVGDGGVVQFQVRGWETAFGSTYETALGQGGPAGKSIVFKMDTAVGLETAMSVRGTASFTTGWAGFAIVPEPSAIALGLVGAGALLLLRRRK